jgi:hypothetical protein
MKGSNRKEYIIQSNTNYAEIIAEIKSKKPISITIYPCKAKHLQPSGKQAVTLVAGIIAETNIVALSLKGLRLGDNIEPITDALKTNATLLTLILSYNNIGLKGLGFIAETLKINRTLEFLDIAGEAIGFGGTRLIAEALVINEGLRTLNLNISQIAIEELSLILNSLKINTILEELNIAYKQIRLEEGQLIIDFLKTGNNLLSLNLAGSQIGLEGIRQLMGSLKVNNNITILDISNNQAGEEGGKYIIDCLKKNRAITSIECDKNEISEETRDLIKLYTQNNKQGYTELGKFITYNKQKILNGSCCTWDSLIVPDHEEEISPVIPSAIRSFLALLPKINSIYLGEVMIKDKALIDNLKLLIARDFFEISGICKKFDDDHPLTFFPKEVIALIAYGLPIEVHPKTAEDSVEVTGGLDDN